MNPASKQRNQKKQINDALPASVILEKKPLHNGSIQSVGVQLVLPSRTEYVVAANGEDGVALEQLLHDKMMAEDSRPISRFMFGGGRYYETLGQSYLKEDGSLLRQKGVGGREWSSLQVTAFSGVSLFPLRQSGRNIGVVYEDEEARYCRLNGVVPLDLTVSREKQTRAVLEMLDWILVTNEFSFTDTVRTWFYLDHLLEWYKEFNEVRTGFFKERGVFEKLVPASTGIGAANPWGAALVCDLLAIQPKRPSVGVEAVVSPLQDSALLYASSFSRAVEVRMPSCRSLLISGTASIDAAGKTQYPGNHAAQIERTLQVVTALLKSRGMGWADVTRGIAYFTDMRDQAQFTSLCQNFGVPEFPLAVAHADICRHDLLFELEVDAVKVNEVVLFVCTGNYYRSRFTEILFNTLAPEYGIRTRAISRGLITELISEEMGGMSPYATRGLQEREIVLAEVRRPIQAQESDFMSAALVIAMDEKEHRPMMGQRFPQWVDRIQYWQVADIAELDPEMGLAALEKRVRALLEQMKNE